MVHLEKIEYKPMPVRDLLVEMKDLSELMIDLAYSAALFHSHELAEEVLELETHVDTLAYILKMNTMLAARDAEDAEALVGVSMVASAADKISDAAADIAALAIREIHVHPIVRAAFSKVEEQLVRAEVKPNSILVGKNLGELELAARMGVDVIAIRRKKNWIINPEGSEVVSDGDILIARGAPHGVEELQLVAEGSVQKLGD
ncbi:MAG: potassium channel protein [Candidatus Bathyarchaeota archaeon]|nr:potassium channel protein [Candidatus Bathyarchaeota archaeon]MDH5733752.1 potassium channel protein [Candidatus Bathyarchaeota archaeon]